MVLRGSALLCAVVAAGCGLGRPDAPPPQSARPVTSTVTADGGNHLQITSHTRVESARLPLPAPEVWPALVDVYRDLGFAVHVLDADALHIGISRLPLTARLGTEPVSTFILCGSTAGVVEVANSFRVDAVLNSYIVARDTGSSVLQTTLNASARDPFSNTAPRQCTSTGELERRIAEGVRDRLDLAAAAEAPPAPRVGEPHGVPAQPRVVTPPTPPQWQTSAGSSPVLLAASGVASGLAGVYLGSMIDADCTERCLNAKGTLWPLVVGSAATPLGVHVANGRRGSFLRGFLMASGWAMAGMVAAGAADDTRVLWAIAPGQILSVVLTERASARAAERDRQRQLEYQRDD